MFKSIGFAFSSVAEITILSLGFFWLGSFLDNRILTTKPWLSVCFTFIGLTLGFYKLYKSYLKSNEVSDKESSNH